MSCQAPLDENMSTSHAFMMRLHEDILNDEMCAKVMKGIETNQQLGNGSGAHLLLHRSLWYTSIIIYIRHGIDIRQCPEPHPAIEACN
jgi:hypothetical protein